MKAFVSLLLIFAHQFLHLAQSQEIRDFGATKIFIRRDGDANVVTKGNSASFFIIGDWGGLPVFPYRTIIEEQISKLMDQLSKASNSLFQLALGDNFYFDGVKNSNDKRFQETYEDVFNTTYLRDTPWFVLLGNHDHYGNASAQLEYAKKSKRWIFPSLNYTIDIKVNNGKDSLMSIVMIDTVVMCGNSPYYDSGQPVFESYEAKVRAADYWIDLEKRLAAIAATDVPYIIVAGHFPVWSIAEHGPTQCLVDNLRPLLHKYGVTAYLCGHDHNLQHLQDTYLGHTVDYILSGSSNFVDDSNAHSNAVPSGSLKFHWADKSVVVNGGFVLAEANPNNVTIIYYKTTGESIYKTVLYPRF